MKPETLKHKVEAFLGAHFGLPFSFNIGLGVLCQQASLYALCLSFPYLCRSAAGPEPLPGSLPWPDTTIPRPVSRATWAGTVQQPQESVNSL